MNLQRLMYSGFLMLAAAGAARADCGGLAAAYLFGYGGNGNAGFRNYVPSPPYFALHPPVYYGQRYTRPYGVSPFATWPQLQGNPTYAPQQHVDRAHVIVNPHYQSGSSSAAAGGVVQNRAVEPLVIDNPYFESASPAARFTNK